MSSATSDLLHKIDGALETTSSCQDTDALLGDCCLSSVSGDVEMQDSFCSSLTEENITVTKSSIYDTTNAYSMLKSSSFIDNSDESDFEFETTSQDNSSIHIIPSTDTEIKSFLSLFNAKYGFEAKNLTQVIQSCDELINRKSKDTSKVIQKESKSIQQFIDQINKLEEENKTLKENLNNITTENASLKLHISNTQVQTKMVDQQNNSLKSDLTNIQSAIKQMQEIMETQLNDLSRLGQQRLELVAIINRQTRLIAELENLKTPQTIIQQQVQPPTQQTSQNNEKINDDLYNLLSAISKVVEDNIPSSIFAQIKTIRDNSVASVHERILLIAKTLSSTIDSQTKQISDNNASINNLSRTNSDLKNKCSQLIRTFQEQLMFIKTLSSSKDLQTIVSGEQFTAEYKHDIVRRYCTMTKFVEEVIGEISSEKFAESFSSPPEVDQTHVYDLLTTHDIDQQLETILGRIDVNNYDALEVMNILAAQIFINGILKSHITELNSRMAVIQREIMIAKQPTNEVDEDSLRLLRQMQKQQLKIHKFLSKICPGDNDSLYEHLKRAFSTLAELQNSSYDESENERTAEIQTEEKQINNQSQQQQQVVAAEIIASREAEIREEYQDQIKTLLKTIKKLESTNTKLAQKYNEEHEFRKKVSLKVKQTADELERQKNVAKEAEARASMIEKQSELRIKSVEQDRANAEAIIIQQSGLKEEIVSIKEKHRNEIEEFAKKLESAQSKIAALTKKNDDIMANVQRIKKQRHMLGAQIERLQCANRMLQDTIDVQNARTKRECKDQLSEVQVQLATANRELSKQTSLNEELTAKTSKLAAELATVSAAKKTVELKLRTAEERIQIEKAGFQQKLTTKQTVIHAENMSKVSNLQSQIDSASAKLAAATLSGKVSDGLNSLVEMVIEELSNLRSSQSTYIKTIDSVTRAQKLLDCQTPQEISAAVESVLNKLEVLKLQQIEAPKSPKNVDDDRQKRQQKMFESAQQAAKQWEQWAKRLNGVIHEGDTKTACDSSELRLSLEECILASLSHRRIFDRVTSLRSQKSLLLRFDRRLMGPVDRSIDMRQLMIITVALRRMQKLAGCIPLSPFANPTI